MLIAYDTETDGLPKKFSPIDHPSQPHIVDLGAALYDEDGVEKAAFSFLIIPEDYEIPPEMTAIHGVSTDIAARFGVPLDVALEAFTAFYAQAEVQCGHNIDFDIQILRIAKARTGRGPFANSPRQFCTMRASTPILNLPPSAKMLAAGFKGPRRPTLSATYEHFFGEPLEDAHTALADARGAAKIYFELKKRGLV